MEKQEIIERIISNYKWLIRISGISAFISTATIPISIIIFFIWPLYPEDILTVIQNDRIAGIMGNE